LKRQFEPGRFVSQEERFAASEPEALSKIQRLCELRLESFQKRTKILSKNEKESFEEHATETFQRGFLQRSSTKTSTIASNSTVS
jgi:hypothetical protein